MNRRFLGALLIFCPHLVAAATVIDAGSVKKEGVRVTLAYLDAPALNEECGEVGFRWACGVEARNELRKLIRGREVECKEKERQFVCFVGSREINAEMVVRGWSKARSDAPDVYKRYERKAMARKIGLWKTSIAE